MAGVGARSETQHHASTTTWRVMPEPVRATLIRPPSATRAVTRPRATVRPPLERRRSMAVATCGAMRCRRTSQRTRKVPKESTLLGGRQAPPDGDRVRPKPIDHLAPVIGAPRSGPERPQSVASRPGRCRTRLHEWRHVRCWRHSMRLRQQPVRGHHHQIAPVSTITQRECDVDRRQAGAHDEHPGRHGDRGDTRPGPRVRTTPGRSRSMGTGADAWPVASTTLSARTSRPSSSVSSTRDPSASSSRPPWPGGARASPWHRGQAPGRASHAGTARTASGAGSRRHPPRGPTHATNRGSGPGHPGRRSCRCTRTFSRWAARRCRRRAPTPSSAAGSMTMIRRGASTMDAPRGGSRRACRPHRHRR